MATATTTATQQIGNTFQLKRQGKVVYLGCAQRPDTLQAADLRNSCFIVSMGTDTAISIVYRYSFIDNCIDSIIIYYIYVYNTSTIYNIQCNVFYIYNYMFLEYSPI